MRLRLHTTIGKLYAAHFLTGLVFWYGIEKLFMQSIGIDAAEIGILSAFLMGTTFVLDLPSGVVADRWSRKGLLIFAMCCLTLSTITAVTASGVLQYAVAYIFYGVYIVSTTGTFQAVIYDALHEEGRAQSYSKVVGGMYALFLAGAGVASLAGGFLANISLALPFWLTLVSCGLNLAVLASMREPTFHKRQQQPDFFGQLGQSARALFGIALLRSLTVLWCALGVSELFKEDFSQLYILHFTDSTVILGALWMTYALAWATGSMAAHRFKTQLDLLIVASLGLLVIISLTDTAWGIAIFMLQAIVSAAAANLIETRIQDATPSAVRASILSVVSSIGRLTWLPVSLLFGWLINTYDVFWALRFVGFVSGLALVYRILVGRARLVKATPLREPLVERQPEML